MLLKLKTIFDSDWNQKYKIPDSITWQQAGRYSRTRCLL